MEQHDLLSNDLLISGISQSNLITAARWGKLLSIVGFIFSGLTLLGGIYLASGKSSLSTYAYNPDAAKYAGIVYIICGVIMIFPCRFVNKFSNKIQEAFRSTSQESLDIAFANLKALFKFYGICTIVMLVIFALAFLGGLGTMMMN